MRINDFVTILAEQIKLAFVGEIKITLQEQFTFNDPFRIIELILQDSCDSCDKVRTSKTSSD